MERERELTAKVARQIREQLPLVNDQVLLAYVNQLGQEIVAVTEPQPFIYRFAIIEDDHLNAFTVGGGYVYIHSGVLAQAGDVSELVGVLAHEVAHVRERHIARRGEGTGVATLITLVTLAAVALGGADPGMIAVGQGVNVALQLRNSRAAEAEADREGIAYMVEAGYDPDGMRRFFQRLLAANPGSAEIPAYLYTHPDVKDRVVAARVEMKRIEVPDDLRREDMRLALMQQRLAQLIEPIAGGSGLLARPEFDRKLTDGLLEEAQAEKQAGNCEAADLLLQRAEDLEPNDPRVPLMRADCAAERGDLKAARDHLTRAFDLDPNVPLVQSRLGSMHARLGSRIAAAFYLEQAATGFRPGSPGRKRVELELQRLTFPVLEEAGLKGGGRDSEGARFWQGDSIEWWGQLSQPFISLNPRVRVRWIGPGGEVARQETVLMSPFGRVSSELDTAEVAPGDWVVEASAGDAPVDRREFHILSRDGSVD